LKTGLLRRCARNDEKARRLGEAAGRFYAIVSN
jgi:hypothetical protein